MLNTSLTRLPYIRSSTSHTHSLSTLHRTRVTLLTTSGLSTPATLSHLFTSPPPWPHDLLRPHRVVVVGLAHLPTRNARPANVRNPEWDSTLSNGPWERVHSAKSSVGTTMTKTQRLFGIMLTSRSGNAWCDRTPGRSQVDQPCKDHDPRHECASQERDSIPQGSATSPYHQIVRVTRISICQPH